MAHTPSKPAPHPPPPPASAPAPPPAPPPTAAEKKDINAGLKKCASPEEALALAMGGHRLRRADMEEGDWVSGSHSYGVPSIVRPLNDKMKAVFEGDLYLLPN